MFLTPAELVDLTGYQRHADQRKWLTARGWVFEVAATGRPIVSIAYAKQRLGGSVADQVPANKKPVVFAHGPWASFGITPQAWYEQQKHNILFEIEYLSEKAISYRYKQNIVSNSTCVYFLFHKLELVYVGKTNNITARLAQHFERKDFDSVAFIDVPDLFVDEVELYYIRKFCPPYNIAGLIE